MSYFIGSNIKNAFENKKNEFEFIYDLWYAKHNTNIKILTLLYLKLFLINKYAFHQFDTNNNNATCVTGICVLAYIYLKFVLIKFYCIH